LQTLAQEQQQRCRDAIYRYIDLSNEQAFLHEKKRVTDEAWIEWRTGIKGNMELPAFKEVWLEVLNSLAIVSRNYGQSEGGPSIRALVDAH
jgi:hypothetical protein